MKCPNCGVELEFLEEYDHSPLIYEVRINERRKAIEWEFIRACDSTRPPEYFCPSCGHSLGIDLSEKEIRQLLS
jgi:transcription initiation factor IIE alpha subunit